MTPTESDWRLQGQEAYMQNIYLQFMPWASENPNWDHDHCEFCSAKFGNQNIPDALHEGYTSADRYRWVCASCFIDFQSLFKWKLVS